MVKLDYKVVLRISDVLKRIFGKRYRKVYSLTSQTVPWGDSDYWPRLYPNIANRVESFLGEGYFRVEDRNGIRFMQRDELSNHLTATGEQLSETDTNMRVQSVAIYKPNPRIGVRSELSDAIKRIVMEAGGRIKLGESQKTGTNLTIYDVLYNPNT